ncbi:MAG TPA: nitrate/sulfonate/bicarbonate ABC transporter ATP-binding protein [Bryobacteraceae bacterium]|jgi:NitT/TauT family transport system ATP-binding protein|nr:nitrate/sulfonate/bicarbonate ABC transporter ATP-binding protein [Bryobacteraceae bacterium]
MMWQKGDISSADLLNMLNGNSLLSAEHISKTFPLPAGGEQTVLENVSLRVEPGEVVALLGRSGSGKSTLLRILAGLIRPSRGQVLRKGEELRGPNPDTAMVFQSFALLPWLTVQENAELGLTARGVQKQAAEEAALHALQMVGLEGFEGAYPKELSGGMRQRVGFARAFVMKPDVLMMDEPFSALDVLTAENLRGEISDLWERGVFPSRSIVLVTHNIEEAVLLADRIVILGANPGVIRGELRVEMPRPRDRKASRFGALVDYVYTVMTNPGAPVADLPSAQPSRRFPMLPHARVGGISGLLEIIHDRGGREDLPNLADNLRLEIDDLLPAVDASAMLGFATVSQGDVNITEAGREFATAGVHRSHQIFQEQLLKNVPLVKTVLGMLEQKRDGRIGKEFLLDILDEHFSDTEAQRQFETLVDWGRYAQLFEYDSDEEKLYKVEAETEARE